MTIIKYICLHSHTNTCLSPTQ